MSGYNDDFYQREREAKLDVDWDAEFPAFSQDPTSRYNVSSSIVKRGLREPDPAMLFAEGCTEELQHLD